MTAEQYIADLKADASRMKVVVALIFNMRQRGIINSFIIAAILSVVSKECDFKPKNEIGYGGTPNDRIRAVFGSRLMGYNDQQLTDLKKNDEAFFNAVYGGRYGNASFEGYKYRGRGFNQLTFKGNYQQIGKQIGVDLVSNPDQLNNLDTSTKALIQYFLNRFNETGSKLHTYHADTINDFNSLYDAVMATYNANAGWGTDITNDPTGGKQKTLDRSSFFLEIVSQNNS
jgi:predicted chitinase